jgi:acyl-CoA thioester hydrolase
MSRLRDEPWRLNASNYAQVFDLRATFGDMDSFGHLNNVALARMLEEGRVSLTIALVGARYLVRPGPDLKLFLANTAIDYVNQGEYPGNVTVASAITSVGRSSIHQAGALYQNGQCIALAQSVLVHIVSGKPTEMNDALRLRLEQYQARLSE